MKNFEKKTNLNEYPQINLNISEIYQLFNKNSRLGITGSRNLGNTCYMNSSIQCFSNSIDLTYYFLSKEYKKDINEKNKLGFEGDLAKQYYKILFSLWILNEKTIDLSEFKSTFSKKAKLFRGFNQQDAHEFITFLLDYLNEDLNKISKKPYEEIDEQKKYELDLDCALRFWDLNFRRNNSIITKLFTGQFKSTIICPLCKRISTSYDVFNTFSLPIPKRNFEKKNQNYLNKKSYRNQNNDGNDFSKKEKQIELYYIPKYSIRTTIKIILNGKKNITYEEITKELIKNQNFPYQIKILSFFQVLNKLLTKIPNDSENFNYSLTNFCCEKEDNKYESIIPLYIKASSEDSLSAYPRLFFVYNKMKPFNFSKKIFFFARKYIKLSEIENENRNFEKILQEYIQNIRFMDERITKIMASEFNEIYQNENDQYNDLRNNFPYSVYLEKENNKIIVPIFENNFSVEKIIKLINDKNYKLYLDFIPNSKYIKKDKLKFNNYRLLENENQFNNNNKNNISLNHNYNNNLNQEKTITLYDCFELFRREETLEKGNEWYCSKCKKFVLAKKKLELFYLPKLFIICLKRFSTETHHFSKNNILIDFPIENMDMEEYVEGPEKKKSQYELYAVCQHYGNIYGGHYTSLCKNYFYKKWFLYNDDYVNEFNEKKIVSEAAYILFYRRKE
jgi:ubiquitin carboxyl-terminal hydrolase 4/11/15